MGISKIKTTALILAAGYGSRLGKVTEKTPKPMIKVGGKTILEHNINLCKKYNIEDIYINTHYLSNVIENYFLDGRDQKVNIKYSYEKKILGTAGAIIPLLNQLSDPFLLLYGDNLTEINIADLISFHENNKSDFTIVTHQLKDASRSGVLEIDSNNYVRKFIEKPTVKFTELKWVNSGVYFINSSIIKDIVKEGSDFGRNIIPKLIEAKSKVFAFKIYSKVKAFDTPELLKNEQIN